MNNWLRLALCATLAVVQLAAADEALPGWQAGQARAALIAFIGSVTDPDSPVFRPAVERIAVFDHDGTLIVEQPQPVQMSFVHERVRQLAPAHPEWADLPAFKAVLANDESALADSGFRGAAALVNAAQGNVSQAEFRVAIDEFLLRARHPRFDRVYPALVYQPMVELIALLQAHEFRVFIVSSGGVEFIRALSESAYGVSREQVVGSVMKYQLRTGKGPAQIWRKTGFQSLNAGSFKVLNIDRHIGRRPILAVGNSDGDLEMLDYTESGPGTLAVLLRHDDAEREYVYADDSVRVLPLAEARGWVQVSMTTDFRQVFSIEDGS